MNLAFAISARAVDDVTNFAKMKDIIKAIVQKFGSHRIHYSVITFGDPPNAVLPFDRRLPSDEDLERFVGKYCKIIGVVKFSRGSCIGRGGESLEETQFLFSLEALDICKRVSKKRAY